MAEDGLFRELCKPETLRIGWHLAHADSRDDFILDPASYEDFAFNLSDRLAYLIREVRSHRYRPRALLEIDIPKSGLGVRPGNVLPIDEAALLHSIMYVLAPRLDKKLSDSVYSYRLAKDWERRVRRGRSLFREGDDEIPFLRGVTIRKMDPLEPWYVAWPEFDRQRIAAVREKGYTHLTKTDISAYFENVDLGLLQAQMLRLVPGERTLVALLMRILESWTRTTSGGVPVGRGIPQGNDVSSFLGNIYLLPLDQSLKRFCAATGSRWLRYVDDVEIYTRNERDARAVVIIINAALRQLYLNLQGSKTDILSGEKLEKALERAESEALDAASGQLQKLDARKKENAKAVSAILANLKPAVSRFRRNLPASVTALSSNESRTFRRALTIWGISGDAYFLESALAALREPPEHRILMKSLRYLSQLPYRHHDRIVDEILRVLSDETPLLPYHSAAMLQALRSLHPTVERLNLARQVTVIGLRKRAEWPVRQQALQLLAVLPAREPTALNRALASLAHHHPFVRRAALVMLTRTSAAAFRENISSRVHDPDPAVSRLAGYWYRLSSDANFSRDEFARITRGEPNDQHFLWNMPKYWVIRTTEAEDVARSLRKQVERHAQSKSARVQYHVRKLTELTAWAVRKAEARSVKPEPRRRAPAA